MRIVICVKFSITNVVKSSILYPNKGLVIIKTVGEEFNYVVKVYNYLNCATLLHKLVRERYPSVYAKNISFERVGV